jgi:hypothetical protein
MKTTRPLTTNLLVFTQASLRSVKGGLRRPVILLLLLLTVFFVLEFSYPRFPSTDEIFFKSAGRNVGQGGPLAAPELEGFLHFDPPIEQIYFAYPPLYPWLFGQWARATGFGWAACVGYDALISAALTLVVFVVTDAVAGVLLGPASLGIAFRLLPALLTLLFREVARPDELGMLLGFTNAWWLLGPSLFPRWSVRRYFISGALVGLMLCTSVGVLLAFMPLLAALWLRRGQKMREMATSVAATGLGVGVTVALCLTPLFLAHPDFYQQFLVHTSKVVLGSSPWNRLAEGLSLAWQVAPQRLFILFATVPVLCLGIVTFWRAGRVGETLTFFVAPLVGFGLLICVRPEYTYFWFLEPWFLIGAVVVTAHLWRQRRFRLAVTGWLVAWLAVASVWPVQAYIVRIALAPEQRLAPNAQKLRDLIPTGAGVLTLGGWWALGSDRTVYDPMFSDLQDLTRIEYFVTDGNGTGKPGVWFPPNNPRYDAMVREHFEIISETLPSGPIRVFGFKVSHSGYGFGTVVMRRTPAQTR